MLQACGVVAKQPAKLLESQRQTAEYEQRLETAMLQRRESAEALGNVQDRVQLGYEEGFR